MPIVHMMNNHQDFSNLDYPNGAYCTLNEVDMSESGYANRTWGMQYSFEEWRVKTALILYSTHHGLCLHEREENGYHDSDFYMTVWNPEKGCTEEFCFATTRGWSYPCYASSVDATPEARAAYHAWLAEQQRRQRVTYRWNERKRIRKMAADAAVTVDQLKKLYRCYSNDDFQRIFKLLTTKLRSDFRKKLAEHCRNWLSDPTPKYSKPFSYKQMQYI